jgi:uncharacterized protein YciI
MKYVVFYEASPDFRAKAPLHFEAHRALWKQFHTEGKLLLIGPFTETSGGAMGVFTTRSAAEEFVQADPFVANKVVATWVIREWNEALAP